MNSTPIMSKRLVHIYSSLLLFFSSSFLPSSSFRIYYCWVEYRHLSLSLVVAARMLPVFATDVFFGVVVGVLLPFLRTVFFFLVCSVFTLLLVNIIFLFSVFLTSRQISPCCLHLVQILPLYKAMLPDALSAAALLGQVGGPHTTFFLINIYVSTQ